MEYQENKAFKQVKQKVTCYFSDMIDIMKDPKLWKKSQGCTFSINSTLAEMLVFDDPTIKKAIFVVRLFYTSILLPQ